MAGSPGGIGRREVLAGAAALALTPLPALPATDYNARIAWRGADTGFSLARSSRKPIFLVVQAEWCPACRRYAHLFHEDAVVQKLSRFVPVLLDQDRDRIERRFRPDGGYIPRSMVLSPEGEIYEDITGPYSSRYFLPPSDAGFLLGFLDQGLARAGGRPVPRFTSRPVRKTVPDGEALKPSFSRPSAGGSTGGPKRIRVE